MLPCSSSFLRQQLFFNRSPSPLILASSPFPRRRSSISCKAMDQQERTEKDEHGLQQPQNPSNQQPTEAGKEGAKSSREFMFEAYGDKYATRSAEEGYGHMASGEMDPFHKNVRGDVAEELGIPELKNRGKSSKDKDVKASTDQQQQENVNVRNNK